MALRRLDRTYYESIKDGLVAFGIHELSHQAEVIRAAQSYADSTWYYPPDEDAEDAADEEKPPVDEYIRGEYGDIVVWTPASMTYLAIGHNYRGFEFDMLDGHRIVLKVLRSGYELHGIRRGDPTITHITFDDVRVRQPRTGRADSGLDSTTCPKCHTTLPATGRCDFCA